MNTLLKLDYFFILLGATLIVISIMSFRDTANPRRFATGGFWALYAIIFLVGEWLPPIMVGGAVVVMALIAGLGGVAQGKYQQFTAQERRDSALKLGNKLLYPALAIPFVTMIGSVFFSKTQVGGMFLLDQKNFTLVSLGIGCIVALALACRVTGSTPMQGMREARRLIDSMGWAVVLPQMLAVLGLLFMDAGVGKAVAKVTTTYIPMDLKFVAVAVYCIGMAVFTMIMGNAFAAFPVMMAAVGLPLLIKHYDGDPAVVAAIGMLAGFCGTLMTPMAANFNLVPAALLELKNPYGVIRAQVGTALPLLAVNILFIWLFAF